jgi:hypothetical protein
VAVTEFAATQEQAVHGAAQKMVHLLDSTLGRLNARRGKSPEVTLPASEATPSE